MSITHPDVPVSRRQVRSAGIASISGWAMDLYDLTIVLYVAAVIGPLLFPAGNETLQLTFVYASFAITLLFRPLGSAIFGAYADRHGRKRSMLVAVVGVGVSTALMGAVPTHEQAGLLAPVLFLALRVIQGVFVGGVVASTHTLGTETVAPEHRGLMSGIVAGGGAGLGAVLASVVYFIVSAAVPKADFAVYGWRIMFATGLITAALSLYVYRRTEESPLWKAGQARTGRRRSPIRELFGATYRRRMLLGIAVCAGGATTYYLTMGYFPTYLVTAAGLDRTAAAKILLLANVGVIVGGLLGGHLSDRFGRRVVFLAFGLPNVVLLPLLYSWLGDLTSLAGITAVATVMGVLTMSAGAPMLIFLNELFPTEIRATGTGLGWNLGFAVGGIAPAIVTALSPQISDVPLRLYVGLAAASLVLVAGALAAGETRHHGLRTSPATPDPTVRPA